MNENLHRCSQFCVFQPWEDSSLWRQLESCTQNKVKCLQGRLKSFLSVRWTVGFPSELDEDRGGRVTQETRLSPPLLSGRHCIVILLVQHLEPMDLLVWFAGRLGSTDPVYLLRWWRGRPSPG